MLPGRVAWSQRQVAALASVFCESRLEKALVSVVSRAKRVAIQDQQRVSSACDFSVVESRTLTLPSGFFSLSKPGWRDSLGSARFVPPGQRRGAGIRPDLGI
ncbi:unnamed protein product [Rangifer tarandus platyrhynchus]|uniref:Uncharacterized protein n=1 Tax=Rangifer tarandus platyrhynchus TaxID=3082113 RepID=A0AC59YEK9_RANTA